MRRCLLLAVLGSLAVAACGDDEPVSGTRGPCAAGGALNECAPFPLTPEGACGYLVECGLIREADGGDYAECVRELNQRATQGVLEFTLGCIAASGCDEAGYCLALGGG